MEAFLFLGLIVSIWFGSTLIWVYLEATPRAVIFRDIQYLVCWLLLGAGFIGLTAGLGIVGLIGGHLTVFISGLMLFWLRVFGD